MRMIKNVVSVCLSAAMILQSFTFTTAFAELPNYLWRDVKVGDFTFRYMPDYPIDGECTISAVSDSDEQDRIKSHDTLEIPEMLDGYRVTVIGENYKPITKNYETDEVKLTTVKLPHSIRRIRKSALRESYIESLDTVYIDFTNLEDVADSAFGTTPKVSEVYVYDSIDKAYYSTSDDLEKFRELVSIEGVKFEAMSDKLDCYMIAESEYKKNPNLNGKLEFLNALAQSEYEYIVAQMYAKEVIEKYNLADPSLNNMQKMEKITNFIRTNTRYSKLYTYNEDQSKSLVMSGLKNSPTSAIGFHSSVCGGLAYEFDMLSRLSIGDEIATRDRDLLCIYLPSHAANVVRPVHSDDNKGYYIVDNTSTVFMQCAGDINGNYDVTQDSYIYDYRAFYSDEHKEVEVVTDPKMFYDGISFVFLHDETKGALHIEMGEKGKIGECNFIDFMSYEETEPETYLEQLPRSKCPRISGLNLYIDPFRYYEMRISNSKGEAVFGADGEHKFKLGDAEYSCTVEVIPYNTDTPYGKVKPHTAYDGYFDITIKQLTEDPKPDVYTTTTVPHKTTTTTTTTTTTKATTTTKKATTTTTKATTTTTKATTTTKKATITTTKATTTTTKATTAKATTTTTKATTTTTKATTTRPTTTTTKATTSTTTSATTTAKAVLIVGDANLDGKVTVADAVAILQYIANKDKYNLKEEAKKTADCYHVGDGITANDALAIQKFDAGVISSLPARS